MNKTNNTEIINQQAQYNQYDRAFGAYRILDGSGAQKRPGDLLESQNPYKKSRVIETTLAHQVRSYPLSAWTNSIKRMSLLDIKMTTIYQFSVYSDSRILDFKEKNEEFLKIGDVCYKEGDYIRAKIIYCELLQSNRWSSILTKQEKWNILFKLGMICYSLPNDIEAKKYFDRCFKLKHNQFVNQLSSYDKKTLLFRAGISNCMNDDHINAIEKYKACLNMLSNNIDKGVVQNALAVAYFILKDWANAEQYYCACCENVEYFNTRENGFQKFLMHKLVEASTNKEKELNELSQIMLLNAATMY